jgi:hypothetical protein
MRKVAEYRKHAEQCRELMLRAADRETMERLAHSWDRLPISANVTLKGNGIPERQSGGRRRRRSSKIQE